MLKILYFLKFYLSVFLVLSFVSPFIFQIYLEKKEAHEQYRRSHPGQSPSTVTLGPPVYPPTPLPLTATGPPPRPPIPPRRNPASTLTSKKEPGEREPVSAQSKGLGKQAAVQQEAVQLPPQQPEEHEEVVGSGGGGGDSGGGGSLDSAFSLMEGDFSMSMERFSEQRKIKQLQLDGADFMHYIKVGLAHCLCRVRLWKTRLYMCIEY